MPKGGKRDGAGRPTREEAAKRAKLLALAIKQGPEITPWQFLKGIMNDPSASKVMRMQAAIALSKLPPEDPPAAAAVSPPTPPIILAIPRGCFLSEEQIANIDQLIPHGVPIEPHTGTADWTKTASADRREQPAPEPVVERLEVVEEPLPVRQMDPAPNVTKLRPHERTYVEGARHDRSRHPSALDPFRHKPRDPFDAA
jgi:hypothetical protein